MNTLSIILTIIQVICALFLIVTVLLQSGKRAGLSGAVAGGAETFFGKNKASSWEGRLVKLTVAVAILFVVLTVVLNLI